MEAEDNRIDLDYEVRIRNLMLATGKSRNELEKEMEAFRPTVPNAAPHVLISVFAASVYNLSREQIMRPSDRIMVLRSSRKVSKNGSFYTIYDAINFEGRLLRVYDYIDACNMKTGFMYNIMDFRFGEDMYTYRVSDRTTVTELGRGKLSSIISFQLIPEINGVGFCRLNVLGVKVGLFKVCPVCGRKADGVCSICRKKGVEKKWVMVDVTDGVNTEARMFLKTDDSLMEIGLSQGDRISALVQRLPDRGKGETFNIIYFEKEEKPNSLAVKENSGKVQHVMDEIVAERIVSILMETPCSREQLYDRLKKYFPVGEDQFTKVLDTLMQADRVGEEGGLYWSKL
ncbi:MAG: hypothetical protein QXK18_07850 [Candidatus Bathyarchaeia archaeon]